MSVDVIIAAIAVEVVAPVGGRISASGKGMPEDIIVATAAMNRVRSTIALKAGISVRVTIEICSAIVAVISIYCIIVRPIEIKFTVKIIVVRIVSREGATEIRRVPGDHQNAFRKFQSMWVYAP
ncbi:hypothetical protein OH818_02090 [Jiella pelagia]|uniref:Uncharacterized protein n=1 Tax=Jiella pelagia TaxID=2986949 RepID=A0ABY7C279_9HYPH|nr:hypothetical protein [Jiella pelagia]WAP69139.1 hypothetical protein OH818_02090 [Jiella pelagia]